MTRFEVYCFELVLTEAALVRTPVWEKFSVHCMGSVLPERPRPRWEDKDLKEIRANTRSWIVSAQDRGYLGVLAIAALNLRVP